MKFTTTSALIALGLAGNAAADTSSSKSFAKGHPHPFSHGECKTTSTVVVTSTETVTTSVGAGPTYGGGYGGSGAPVTITVTSTVAAGAGGFSYGGGSGPSSSASAVGGGYGGGNGGGNGGGKGSVISTVGTSGTNAYPISTPTMSPPTTHAAPTYTWGTNVTSSSPQPTGGACNSPSDRQTWCGGFDINTDTTTTWPTTGNQCKYSLTITNTTCDYDGSGERLCFAISANGGPATVPGPLIECNWGDEVVIDVTNELPDNGTAIHWHGIRQLGTNPNDGVPGVTECALAPGQTRTYKFQATQYGSSWYHSHYLTQYGDGVRGPIIIHGPATANYDVDMGTVMVDDL